MIRKDGNRYGAIYELSGREIYIAWRTQKQAFRNGERNLTEATRKGVICWALDCDTVRQMKQRGISVIGISELETDKLYITTVDHYMTSPIRDYTDQGGARQWYLPMKDFTLRYVKIKRPPSKRRR